MADLLHFNPSRVVDTNGNPVSGAKAYFYDSGTATPRATYTDSTLTVENPWPLVANASGVFPGAFVSGSEPVKVNVTDADGASLPGYPIDPAVRQLGAITGASELPFRPTAEIVADNVQDAIEAVQANLVAPLAGVGWGVTGNAPLSSNIDLTNAASGAYRYDGTTLGTFPAGVTKADGGMIMIVRETSSSAAMLMFSGTITAPCYERRMTGSVWGSWVRHANLADVLQLTGTQTAAGNKTFSGSVTIGELQSATVTNDTSSRRYPMVFKVGGTQHWAMSLSTAGGLFFETGTGKTLTVDGALSVTGAFSVTGGIGADSLGGAAAADYAKWSSSEEITASRFKAAAGSASSPSFSFSGDQNTGMYNTSDTSLNFALNGVLRGSITSAGFVGGGAGLTDLNATELKSGTVPNARLSPVWATIRAAAGGMSGGVGQVSFLKYTGGTTLNVDDVVSGVNLSYAYISSSGALATGGASLSGTSWRCLSYVVTNGATTFVRVS